MNALQIVNINHLEQKLEEQLRQLLSKVSGLDPVDIFPAGNRPDLGYDIFATLRTPSGDCVDLLIECKELPRPSQFPAVRQESQRMNDGMRTTVPVLAAPWISQRMAELCYEHGWGWFDLAGNCNLSVPGMLYIERTGFEPVYKRKPAEAKLSTPESARIIRTLLIQQDIARKWTQRELRDACTPEVSLGLVNKVVRYLKDQAYLMDAESGRGFKLHDPLGLLKEWSQHYRFDQHVRYDYFSLLKPATIRARLVEHFADKEVRFALSVFSAASEQAAHVRGELKLWLYLDESLRVAFKNIAQAERVESGANIVVMIPEDLGVLAGERSHPLDNMPATHPVQTYVDLIHTGGRGREAADALLEQQIKPMWKHAQLLW